MSPRSLIISGVILAAIAAGIAQSSSKEVFAGKSFGSSSWATLFPRAQERGLITLLVLGKSGSGWTAGELTDTILVASLDPQRNRAALFSIPRDLLVSLPYGGTSKINALWVLGQQDAILKSPRASLKERSLLIREKVREITGVAVEHVAVVDVAAAESIIEALGGVAVNVEERISDPSFPTPGGGVEHLNIEPGFRVLDGSTAVKYARTRHTKTGDFERIRRQHQIIEAIAAKTKGLNLFKDAPRITALLTSLADHIETTAGLQDLYLILNVARQIPSSNIQTFALESLGSEPLLANSAGTTFVPRAGTFEYKEIRAAVEQVLSAL